MPEQSRPIEEFLDDFIYNDKAAENLRNAEGWCLMYRVDGEWHILWNTGPATLIELLGALDMGKKEIRKELNGD